MRAFSSMMAVCLGAAFLAVGLHAAHSPLSSAAAGGGAVCIDDFGGIAGDGRDDTMALRKAMAHLRANGLKHLVFGKGQYDFFQPDPAHHAYLFRLDGAEGLTVSGAPEGTKLLFHGNTYLVWADNSSNLVFRNLTMDYEVPHFSLGTVTRVAEDGRSFEIEVDRGYPVQDGRKILALLEIGRHDNLPVNGGIAAHYVVAGSKVIAPQMLQVTLKQTLNPELKNGARLLLRHQLYDGNLMRFQHCRNILLENLTVHSAPSMGAVAQYTANFTARKVRFVPSPARGNCPYSIASDGFSAHSCKGRLSIEECEIDGNLDDGINFSQSFYWTIKQRVSRVSAYLGIERANSQEIPALRPGDRLDFLDDRLQVHATLRVVSCTRAPGEKHPLVTFDRELPDFTAGKDLIAFNNEGLQIEIRGSFFRSRRGRGIVLQAGNAVIEGNRFETNYSAIHVTTCLMPWFEAGPARNVIIRGNIFSNCMERTANRTAVIEVNAPLRDPFFPGAEGRLCLDGPHENILIADNQINRTNNSALAIASVVGCEIRGNVIRDASLDPHETWGSKLFWTRNAVTIAGAREVFMAGNRYESSAGKEGRLVIGEACEDIRLEDNPGFKVIREPVLPK